MENALPVLDFLFTVGNMGTGEASDEIPLTEATALLAAERPRNRTPCILTSSDCSTGFFSPPFDLTGGLPTVFFPPRLASPVLLVLTMILLEY